MAYPRLDTYIIHQGKLLRVFAELPGYMYACEDAAQPEEEMVRLTRNEVLQAEPVRRETQPTPPPPPTPGPGPGQP